jgi:hypothetical protein
MRSISCCAFSTSFSIRAGNAPIGDQLAQRHARNFAADRVEAADDDRFRRIIHHQVDAQRLLDSADVAPLPPDDAPLHFVGGQIDAADGELADVVAGDAFERHRDDLAGAAVGFFGGLRFHFADFASHILAGLLFDAFEQHLLRFFRRHGGDALEFGHPLIFDGRQFGFTLGAAGLPLVEFAFAVLDLLQAALGGVETILQPLLDLFQLGAPAGGFGVHLLAPLHLFFLDGELRLFGGGFRLGNDARRLLLGALPYCILTDFFCFDATFTPTGICQITGNAGADQGEEDHQHKRQ